MMKQLFLLLATSIALTANAQLLEFGVLGGANFPNLKIDGGSSISDINIETGTGFHVGAMARINLVIVFVQPELLYTQTKSTYSFKADGVQQPESDYLLQRLDVPIPVGLKLGPVGLFVGPVASFTLNSPDEIFDNSYKSATWGYQAGANIKFLGFLLEAKYEGAFGDQATGATIGGQTFPMDTRQPMYIISAGYFF
jgi:hypothetical protein